MARVEVRRKNESESAAANKSRSNNMKVPFGKAEYWNVQIYGIITLQLGDKLPTDKGNHVCLLLLFFFYLHLCCVKTLSSARRDLMKRWASSWQNDCWWSHESANYNYWLHFLITRSFECSVVRASGELCQKKKKSPPHKEAHNYELTETGWESSVFLHPSFYIFYKRNAEFLLHRSLNSLICLLDEADYTPVILFSDADSSEEQSHVRF